jgi:acetyl/propionyl-CoA carboxylase alpha subunit
MAAAGVPVLPGALVGATGDPADLVRDADAVGYPLLVKAAFGGGGRGMRIVGDPAELGDAVASATREAAAAFGDGTVFLERYVEAPRHIEVQILADAHGEVVSLFERECSIQRRHQKLIEEAPSPAVDEARRAAMGDAAVRAAQAIGYVNAGTVEFVVDEAGQFFFLEVNTRLQVEHPVTEMVTGLDLVALQLQIARGEPLPDTVLGATISGHAIEARLYAEDVAAGFLPVSGPLDVFALGSPGADVRVDAGYVAGNRVSPYYDAMLAKVIAWGPTRAEAAVRLAHALTGARVHGVATNRDLLVAVLRHPEFLAGRTDTHFLERHGPDTLVAPPDDASVTAAAVAVGLATEAAERATSPVPVGVPPSWRNVGPAARPEVLRLGGRTITVDVAGRVTGAVAVDGEPVALVVHACDAGRVDLEVAGVRGVYAVSATDDRRAVDGPGVSVTFVAEPRFPLPTRDTAAGSLVAPMPGAVVAVGATAGASVVRGATLVTLEAMKMEHAVRAPADGAVVEVRVAVGDQVEAGDVLVVLDVLVVPDREDAS